MHEPLRKLSHKFFSCQKRQQKLKKTFLSFSVPQDFISVCVGARRWHGLGGQASGLAGLPILTHQLSGELFHSVSLSRCWRSPHNQSQYIIVDDFFFFGGGGRGAILLLSSSGLDGSLQPTACDLHREHVEMWTCYISSPLYVVCSGTLGKVLVKTTHWDGAQKVQNSAQSTSQKVIHNSTNFPEPRSLFILRLSAWQVTEKFVWKCFHDKSCLMYFWDCHISLFIYIYFFFFFPRTECAIRQSVSQMLSTDFTGSQARQQTCPKLKCLGFCAGGRWY